MLAGTNGATKLDSTPGNSLDKGAELDGQIKLELCKNCKEYKRTVEDGVCYDCNYKKLPINTSELNNFRLKEPLMVYEYGIIHMNDKERDLIIQQCKDLQSALQSLIEFAYENMSELRKFRDFHNQNASDMLERELHNEIISGAGKR
jgi:hypothetical protein